MSALDKNSIIAVIGSGAMGAGIAQVAAVAGYTVKLYDTRPEAVSKALADIAKVFDKLVDKGRMSAADAAAANARLRAAGALADVADAKLVVEAIVENLDVKRALFADLEGIVGDDCILATNTSSLSVTTIAAKLKKPERFGGFHFFNPVPLMKLVEVIDGVRSAPWVGDALMEIGRRMGRDPIRLQDAPGFIVNQIGRGFTVESAHIASEGIASFVEIDRIMR